MIELIIKYNGAIHSALETFPVQIEILSCSYAILTLEEDTIPFLNSIPEIEYLEYPKTLTRFLKAGCDKSCISTVKYNSWLGLTGKGVMVAIIDSGIDYTHLDFIDEDGNSRILYLWDQTIDGNPPNGFLHGTQYSQSDLTEIIHSNIPRTSIPSRDTIGHGTAVAGIIAGNGRTSNNAETGIASESTIIAVKLGNTGRDQFPRTTEIMRAIKYVQDRAIEANMPLVINLSYGTNNGGHDGKSLFEKFISSMAERWKTVIVVAAGNEGDAGHHKKINLLSNQTSVINFTHNNQQNELYLTIWKNFADTVTLELISPSGRTSGIIMPTQSVTHTTIDNYKVNIFYRQPNHHSEKQEIYLLLTAQSGSTPSGLWQLRISAKKIVVGTMDLWLPTKEDVSQSSVFLEPTAEDTCTIPATAENIICVGGYNSKIDVFSDFSGRGNEKNPTKPDLLAPSVNVLTTKAGGSYDTYTGTSIAAPFVAGSAALMMQWGIIDGHDPNLYGQRVKAFLCRDAKRLSNMTYPNSLYGYGILNLCDCMSDLIDYNQNGGVYY